MSLIYYYTIIAIILWAHKIWNIPDYNFMIEDKNKRNSKKQIVFNVIQSAPRFEIPSGTLDEWI